MVRRVDDSSGKIAEGFGEYVKSIKVYRKIDYSFSAKSEIGTDWLYHNDVTKDGISFVWNGDVCNVDVTSETDGAICNLWYKENQKPNAIENGKSYFIDFDTTNENIYIEVRGINANGYYGGSSVYEMYHPGTFTMPNNAVGFAIRIRTTWFKPCSGAISNIRIYEGKKTFKLPKFMVSFVDDDTANTTAVQRYHDNCVMNGIKGNYAIMAKPCVQGTTNPELLKQYELDGFGMLLHCYDQADSRGIWRPATYDEDEAKKDLLTALKYFENDLGLSNIRYWSYPQGLHWTQIEKIGRFIGCKCAFSSGNYAINDKENADRYFIKRCTLSADDTGTASKTLSAVKDMIDNFTSGDGDGWLIITTHFSEWTSITWSSSDGYQRFNELISYAKSKGCNIMDFPTAFSYYEQYITN